MQTFEELRSDGSTGGVPMNAVSELTIQALNERGANALEKYTISLQAACEAHPPPFGMAWYGDKYRQVSQDPTWLANSLVSNAAKEGEGSRKLWELAGRTGDLGVAEDIRQHAIDEARHARLYIAMIDIAFPDTIDEGFRIALNELSPGYTMRDHPKTQRPSAEAQVLDEIIQMNIGEIRTRIHQLLLRPVIHAHCPSESRNKLKRVLDSLLLDETRHIEYTARIIELAFARGSSDFINRTMSKRLEEFNQITLQEVGGLVFDGA